MPFTIALSGLLSVKGTPLPLPLPFPLLPWFPPPLFEGGGRGPRPFGSLGGLGLLLMSPDDAKEDASMFTEGMGAPAKPQEMSVGAQKKMN